MPSLETDDRRECELSRRNQNRSQSIWLILMAIGLLGAVVYVASALA
jgi:hypothetical protein